MLLLQTEEVRPMSARPEFISVRAVAELLDVTEKTVREWCHLGKLQFVQPGGRVIRIRRASVEALIAPAASRAA
jgi:excisionase family DNA binding protein